MYLSGGLTLSFVGVVSEANLYNFDMVPRTLEILQSFGKKRFWFYRDLRASIECLGRQRFLVSRFEDGACSRVE